MINTNNVLKFNAIYFLVAFVLISLFREYVTQQSLVKSITYSEFLGMLEKNEIKEVVVGKDQISGELNSGTEQHKKYFRTNRVDTEIAEVLNKYGVEFSSTIENTFVKDILSWIVPFLFFFLIWSFFAKKMFGKGGMSSGFMSVGKSKAKIYVESDTKVTFQDVAGADESKAELKELVDFLKQPEKYRKLGTRMPKGVLLVGPPGTGKTLIAKAVAGEAGVPFFSTNGAEFVEMFVGVGAARVRDLFEQAKQKSPCIIFIDEIDALGKTRMGGMGSHGNDEKEQTLNQLLAELDGFDSQSGIILLAATNRPEILDPALLRSGRFDRQVLVDKPDKIGRIAILNLHTKKTKIAEDVDLEKIAALTSGFTGADLENLVNEASLIATRKNANEVVEDDFVQGMERIVAGLEKKNRLINEFERKVVAYHEMGHALVASAMKQSEAVHKVSIVPRGVGALGYTIQRPTDDRYLMTKEELIKKMTVLLGGRAAEKIIFKHLSTGAADDIGKATDIARSMVTKYGMNEALGHVVYDKGGETFLTGPYSSGQGGVYYSDDTAREIDCAVRKLLNNALERAEEVLSKNLEILESSATLLLSKETLNEKELSPFFAQIKY